LIKDVVLSQLSGEIFMSIFVCWCDKNAITNHA